MPRDLTDLMERATSSPPAEPHSATDIVTVASRHLRRRRAGLAGAVALAVVAAAGVGYGVTRGHESTPQPVGPWKYGQTLTLASAVPADTLPGYHLEPWKVPSTQPINTQTGATYHDVDQHGRLIVFTFVGDGSSLGRVRLYDAPGVRRRPLHVPTYPATRTPHETGWKPSFLSPGHLLWLRVAPLPSGAPSGFHVTDLNGRHDIFVPTEFHRGSSSFDGAPTPGSAWVSGDRFWFLVYESSGLHTGVAYTLYSATFSGSLTKVADRVAVADVGGSNVGWVTTGGQVMVASTSGGAPRPVHVPLSPGCRVMSTADLQSFKPFVVSDSAIGVSEVCGTGDGGAGQFLAFDHAGRLLLHLSDGSATAPVVAGDTIVFSGLLSSGFGAGAMRYDLRSGTLARLASSGDEEIQRPRAAGDYVLWYDKAGGHVARMAQ